KRVGIAQAIIHKPDVVILDEPISGLDPKQIVEMRGVVRGLTESATVLVSSHILSEISLTCERVFVIHEGRLVLDGGTKELGKQSKEGRRVQLALRGDEGALTDFFADHARVDAASLRTEPDGLVAADVELIGDDREALIVDLVAKGIGIRGVSDAVSELEQVFLELTKTSAYSTRPKRTVKA
ncbi:MAG: ABC transporter ATP-binding protein, partial [Myxococcota bacterium]